jgi:hypothetical protein
MATSEQVAIDTYCVRFFFELFGAVHWSLYYFESLQGFDCDVKLLTLSANSGQFR